MRVSDPRHDALHPAARTAVVVPIALAIAEVGVGVGNADTALFAAFGSFALLLFCEFSGPPRVQFVANALLMLVGAALISQVYARRLTPAAVRHEDRGHHRVRGLRFPAGPEELADVERTHSRRD